MDAPTVIASNTTWDTNNKLCGDVTVQSGTLTVTAEVTMPFLGTITVQSGVVLIVDGSHICNANVAV